MIVLEAVPVKNERVVDGVTQTFPAKLANVYEVIKGVRKDLYFVTPSALTRPFVSLEGKDRCVIQNWDISSVETDEPEADDLEVFAYEEVFDIIAEVVAAAMGVSADIFPGRYTSQSREGEACMWYETPTNNVKSTNPWTFDAWNRAPGVPTFRIRSAIVQTASKNHRGEIHDNYISIKTALGRWKYDVNEKPRQIAVKRKATEVAEIVSGVVAAGKKTKPSKAALAALESKTD
jgi:hypothetical protein